MKILTAIIVLPFLFISVGNAKELRLVWADEFNYEGYPNQLKWLHEEGLLRNDEIGYFTSRLKNVRVDDGVLIIEAHKESYLNANYTTGSIKSDQSFKYGRIEVRAKMPYGSGSHVGIWLDGANIQEVGWPACGEMDVAEYVGRLPYTIHAYSHFPDPLNPTQYAKTTIGKFTVSTPYNNFHIYAIEWDETQIKYFIDGERVATFNLDIAGTGPDNPFRKEQTFRLSYSLGGWGWDVDDSKLPAKFEVDYVRVYQEMTPPLPPINYLLLK